MAAALENALLVRMEATLSKFERQMAKAQRTAANTSNVIEARFDRMGKKMGASSAKAAGALSRVVNISSGGRFVLQNTAAQLGDIAVQLESGTAASRVMAQQLPQILGGFSALRGVLGIVAPLLGTVAAVGIPVAAMLLTMGSESDKTSEKVRTFAERVKDAQGAIERANAALATAGTGGLADLEERYGRVTEKVRDLALALAEIETRAARLEVGQLIDQALGGEFQSAIDDLFGTAGAALVSAGSDEAKRQAEELRAMIREIETEVQATTAHGGTAPAHLSNQLKELQQELAAVEGRYEDIGTLAADLAVPPDVLASIKEMQERLRSAREADDFGAMADALSDIRTALAAAGNEIEQSVVDGLIHAEDTARRFETVLEDSKVAAEGVGEAAGGIAGGLSPAIAAAQQLAGWLNVSLATARKIAAMGPQGVPGTGKDGKRYSGRGGDPRDMGGSAFDIRNKEGAEFLSSYQAPKAAGGGGGGRGGAARGDDSLDRILERGQQEITSLQRRIELIGKSKAEIAGLTAKYYALDEVKEKGLELDREIAGTGLTLRQTIDQNAESVARLTEEYERSELGRRQFEQGVDAIAGAMANALVEGQNFADAMGQIFRDIAADILKSGIRNAIMSVFDGIGGGAGGGIFGRGGILGGVFGGFRESGGAVTAGRAYVVGEKRPELFVPETSGTILPSVPGGQMASPQVNIYNQSGAEVETQRGPDGRMDIFLRKAIAETIAAGGADGALRGRFGVKPRPRGV